MRLDEAEHVVLKGGKKAVQKIEGKCREIEAELESEQRRTSDNTKVLRKLERKHKEFSYKLEYQLATVENLKVQFLKESKKCNCTN